MKLHQLLAFLLILQMCTSNRCSDNSQCFLKKLFDFSYPQEGVYNILLGNSQDTMNNQIRSYGDFNNDLRTDYLAIDNSGNILLYIYSINDGQYIPQLPISIYKGCSPINFYLYDVNGDNSLDITVWGVLGNGSYCLYPLIQNNLEFTANPSVLPFPPNTNQPSLFEMNIDVAGNQIRTNCLLVFNGSERSILYFSKTDYTFNNWTTYFSGSDIYTTLPFSNLYHWNTFIDLTNDCFPDFVLTNQDNQIQIWIYNSESQKFVFNPNTPPLNSIGTIAALTILDINYDGGLDIVIANTSSITMFMSDNHLSSSSTFCVGGSTSYRYNWASPANFSPQCTLTTQNLQFADLNIDGYPELMLICSSGLMIYKNIFASGSTSTFAPFNEYQDAANSNVNNPQKLVQTASFFDILQNGIIDIIVTLKATNSSMALYNNYLYQNSFYIKGYATNGKTSSAGTQIPGASFYWMNSVGNDQKITIGCQITQTAYNAMPMPYVVGGLGRANNFVEMFSMGRLGQIKPWSPIIPNSQLAIFSGNSDSSSWAIKIFIMPTDSLVYVVIVCIVILTILGTVLLVLKCRKKKAEEPLLPNYM